MVNLLNILRRPATTAADLRKMLEEIDQPAAEAAVAAADATRRQALLGGSDAAVDKAEKALADARRGLDRLLAAKAELEERIPAAETAERDAALAAERAEIAAEADAVVKLMSERWPKVVAEAVDLLKRLEAVEKRREAFGWKLHSLFGINVQPGAEVPKVEPRLKFHVKDWWDGMSILRNTTLLDVSKPGTGWRS